MSAPAIRVELLAIAACTTIDELVVDLSDVTFANVEGLVPVADAKALLQERDKKLVLRGVARVYGPVIRAVGLGDNLHVTDFSERPTVESVQQIPEQADGSGRRYPRRGFPGVAGTRQPSRTVGGLIPEEDHHAQHSTTDGRVEPTATSGKGTMTQQEMLSKTFVELTQTLTTEFDVIDLLHVLADRTLQQLNADAVGLMLTDQRGKLQVMAATSHASRMLELFELQNSEGPCYDCFHSGEQVVNVDLEEVMMRWPSFSSECRAAGFKSVHALPLRLNGQVFGAMNLFCAEHMTLSPTDVAVGQALADVATIGLLHQQSTSNAEILAEQLRTALNSHVTIEQANGVLAEHLHIEPDMAFQRLRAYAKTESLPLTGVAESVLHGHIDPQQLRERTSER